MVGRGGIGKRRIGSILAAIVLCGLIVGVETHHQIDGFRAWTFGFVFLLAAVLTSLVSERFRDAGLVIATLMLGFCVLETAATIIEAKPQLDTTPMSLVSRPEIGWGPGFVGVMHAAKRDLKTGATIFDVDYTIDKDFDREVKSASSGPAVVFFGDSFTFGWGVGDADTLPQRFADLYRGQVRVVDLAISGYAPNQFLREIETGLKDSVIGPNPIAFVFLTSPFHAMRTACKENWVNDAPRYLLIEGRAAHIGRCFEGARRFGHRFLENTALYRVAIRPFVVRLTRADVDLYIQILIDAAKKAKSKYHVKTIVPYVRTEPGYLVGTGYDDDHIIARFRSAGLDVVDMTLVDDPAKNLIYSIKGDGHPTPAANAARAAMLAETLESGGELQKTGRFISRPSP